MRHQGTDVTGPSSVQQKAPIRHLLENESWSFHYTPDVRYGTEPLYLAFQLHSRHLHSLEIRTP